MKALITGGARSGKSRHALALAESLHPHRVFLATAQPLDAEMAARIRAHQAERGPSWRTVEAPLELAPELARDAAVVIDCLTLWVSNLMHAGRDVPREGARLVEAVRAAGNPVVVVTNEVGLGIVPDSALARAFRDHLGTLAQRMAAACDHVALLCAGIPLVLKG